MTTNQTKTTRSRTSRTKDKRKAQFRYVKREYYNVGSLNSKCNNCAALHFRADKVKALSENSPRFAECGDNCVVALATASDLPVLWQNLLADNTRLSQDFQNNIRAHNSRALGCVKTVWCTRGPNTFTLNPTMTVHGRIYYYLDAMVPPSTLSPCFFLLMYAT